MRGEGCFVPTNKKQYFCSCKKNDMMDYQHILESIRRDIVPLEHEGKQADYIPALAAVNPDQWGICIHTLKGEHYALGDWQDVALLLFVGIPLPGTGAWTGTLAASILDMDFKKSVLFVLLGVLLAGAIMLLASLGLFGAIDFLK